MIFCRLFLPRRKKPLPRYQRTTCFSNPRVFRSSNSFHPFLLSFFFPFSLFIPASRRRSGRNICGAVQTSTRVPMEIELFEDKVERGGTREKEHRRGRPVSFGYLLFFFFFFFFLRLRRIADQNILSFYWLFLASERKKKKKISRGAKREKERERGSLVVLGLGVVCFFHWKLNRCIVRLVRLARQAKMSTNLLSSYCADIPWKKNPFASGEKLANVQ